MKEIYAEARHSFHKLKYYGIKAHLNPCVFAGKGKLSTQEERKTRLVWQYPADMTISEGVFAQPLIDAYYKGPLNKLFLTGTNASFKHQEFCSITKGKQFYGFDFSQYDASIAPYLIRMAFSILKDNIEFGAYEDELEIRRAGKGVATRAENAFEGLINYFIYTPFISPEGHLFRKVGGVPSGSHFTNLVESIITRILITWFMLMCRRTQNVKLLRTNGDDSAILIDGSELDIDLFSFLLLTEIGMILKPEKTVFTRTPEEVHISGSYWNKGKPKRDTKELFRMALCSTNYVRDAQTSFNRLIGIWIAGGFMDVRYSQFFEYFQSCYELLQPTTDILTWKLRWLGFEDSFLRGGINYNKIFSRFI